MDTIAIVAIVVVALLLLAVVPALYMSNRKRSHLRDRFGSEYDHAVSQSGRKEAEKDLQERQKRVAKLQLKELDPGQRQTFAAEWQQVQAHFVDDPSDAIVEADRLCERVMNARGYPIIDFERQAADISVDHPEVVSNYRAAHEIAQSHQQAQRSTEDLRQAMVHYRVVFADLLGQTAAAAR